MLKHFPRRARIAVLICSFAIAALSSVGEAQTVAVPIQDLPDDIAVIVNSMNREKLDKNLVRSASTMSHPASRVVVVGDSHAGRLHPPLAEWGLKNNISVDHLAIGGGCPPLLDTFVFTVNQKGTGETCNKTTNETLLKLGDSQYDTIMIVARWGFYSSNLSALDGKVIGKENRQYNSISNDIKMGYVADLPLSRKAFNIGVERTVKYFQSKGKRVIVVTQPPPIGTGFKSCVTAQPSPADVAAKCFLPSYADQMDEIQWSTDTLVKLGHELDFTLVNAKDIFCQGAACKVANKQGIFYIDANHLSHVGASFLAEGVEKVLGAASK